MSNDLSRMIREGLVQKARGRDIQKAILTTHSQLFWITEPHPADVDVRDIARGIALINRFIGHGLYPVSVAAHSLALARVVPEEYQERALFHDATEAYMVDLPRPLKERVGLFEGYSEVEDRLFTVICEAFKLPFRTLESDFYKYDRQMGRAELLVLFPGHGPEYLESIGVSGTAIDEARAWIPWVTYVEAEDAAEDWLLSARMVIGKYANS